MQRLASLGDALFSAVESWYVYTISFVAAWFIGAAIGMAIGTSSFDLSGIFIDGVLVFAIAMGLPPLFFLSWPCLAAAMVFGLYTENRTLRLALLLGLFAVAIWSGFALTRIHWS